MILASVNGPVAAQGPDAWTAYELNMRTGPGTTYSVVAVVPGNTGMILEAHNGDASWVLGRTEDGAHRGWLSGIYLNYAPGFSAFNLPVSNEVVDGAAPPPSDDSAPAPVDDNPAPPVPGGVNAYTIYQLNVRSGPGTNYAVVDTVNGNTGFVLEARNADSSWVLGHTENNTIRGWLSALYMNFTGVTLSSLPVSDEEVSAGGGGSTAPATGPASGEPGSVGGPTILPEGTTENIDYGGIRMGGYNPALIEGIDLTAFPIVPAPTGRTYAIFRDGQNRGNNPNVVSKVGDCSTAHWFFLSPFAWGQYSLGDYAYLQGVVNHFGESLAIESMAAHNGFNVNSVQAPEYANPAYCEPGESPLLCEYRIHQPAVSIIMFGTSELLVMTPYEFDFFLRHIVQQTIDRGIIPVLSTFPGNLGFWDRTVVYNQIVVRVALDYDIPLINLWLALESLPNHGLENDGFHLGEPIGQASCNLTGTNLQTGYATRNLVTMQTLDRIWREVIQ
ncbi:MAG: hypothetical protein GYB65_03535 [Chloroflexi bacterium]|nr:hypothetical protein [Chloroflexota bacterium]